MLLHTSWPSSMAHSLADWALASTITLNMVHIDCGTRKSVVRLLRWSFASKAARVLSISTPSKVSHCVYQSAFVLSVYISVCVCVCGCVCVDV